MEIFSMCWKRREDYFFTNHTGSNSLDYWLMIMDYWYWFKHVILDFLISTGLIT